MFFWLFCFTLRTHAVEYAKLHGNIEELGYYYTEVWVGTPPARQTLVIDLGSQLTSFPCIDCEDCGNHEDEYFDYKASSTAVPIRCDQGIPCSGCADDICEYHEAYDDGSAISGILIEDLVLLGSQDHDQVSLVFGCHEQEDNLFRTQEADGILGLAEPLPGTLSVVDALFVNRSIDTARFSLCFGHNGGYMSVGTSFVEPSEWVPIRSNHFYSVGLEQIYIDSMTLELGSEDFLTVFETGTVFESAVPFVYLTSNVYERVVTELRAFCHSEHNCGTETAEVEDEMKECYVFDSHQFTNTDEFFATFPVLTFSFEGVLVHWEPKNYLFAWPDSPTTFCIGIYDSGNYGNVLGALFMRNLEVVFDTELRMIGLVASECDLFGDTSGLSTTVALDYSPNQLMFSLLAVAGLLLLIGGVCLAISKFNTTKRTRMVEMHMESEA